jgi:septal ring-binding cell division protein DamX
MGVEAFHQAVTTTDGVTWHRVRVGMHASREAAEAAIPGLPAGASPFDPYVARHP